MAIGRYTKALDVDVRATGASRRQQRAEELRPQERVAAVLGGRERVDACETLLLRARADLDSGRHREAALQLRVGLEALLVELDGAVADPGHEEDMAELGARRTDDRRGCERRDPRGARASEQLERVRSIGSRSASGSCGGDASCAAADLGAESR